MNVFKSALTQKSVTADSFDGGFPKISKRLPPMIKNEETADQI